MQKIKHLLGTGTVLSATYISTILPTMIINIITVALQGWAGKKEVFILTNVTMLTYMRRSGWGK